MVIIANHKANVLIGIQMLTSVLLEWMNVINTVTTTLAPTHAPAMIHTPSIQMDSTVMVYTLRIILWPSLHSVL